jgi:hypothetical protein
MMINPDKPSVEIGVVCQWGFNDLHERHLNCSFSRKQQKMFSNAETHCQGICQDGFWCLLYPTVGEIRSFGGWTLWKTWSKILGKLPRLKVGIEAWSSIY